MSINLAVIESESTTVAATNKIPVGLGTGKIALEWLAGIVFGYVQSTRPPDPPSGFIVIWIDTSVNQAKIWKSLILDWVTFA